MGRRGPAPAPVAVKLARGETRPSHVNLESPIVRQSSPRRPPDMEPDAVHVWDHVLREMKNSGVIFGADRDLLRSYCDVTASYTRNVRTLFASGSVVRGRRGRDVVVNPLHRVVRDERDQQRMLARELGLSPSARAGLRIDLGQDRGELDDVIGPPLRLLRRTADQDQ